MPPELLAEHFELESVPALLQPRFNIAPSQDVAVLRLTREGVRKLDHVRWGLVPHWAAEPSIGRRMINARAEGLSQKPAFRSAFQRRRCLVLADGFYEWQQLRKARQPHWIHRADGSPLAFAGLWERWQPKDATERAGASSAESQAQSDGFDSCTIITVPASEPLAAIHPRMPAILDPADYALWLARERGEEDALLALLRPDADLAMHAVGTAVNSPKNDDPDCILSGS